MGGQCNAKPVRRTTGWYRWFAACPCGWRSEASGREDAAALAKRHNTEKQATCSDCGKTADESGYALEPIAGMCLLCLNGPVPGRAK